MARLARFILLLLFLLLPLVVSAQDKALPRVLIIGDNVYNEPSRAMATELKDQATVVYANWGDVHVRSTTTALENLDRLLGYIDRNGKVLDEKDRPQWDVIHFNLGLGDLIHVMPDIKSFRVLPIDAGGVLATSPEQYEQNLDELTKRLLATKAKLIWASTTPIRASSTNVFKLGSEVQYNTIAAKVMSAHRVPVNDMYNHVKSMIDMDKPAGHGADPFHFDRKPIHEPVLDALRKALGLPVAEGDASASR